MKSTKTIKVPDKIVNQVLGQDQAVTIIKKAAQQRRHVLLIGEPGTGKCVGKDTLVSTTEGPLKAEDLFNKFGSNHSVIGDEVYALPTKNLFVHCLNRKGKVTSRKISRLYKSKRKKALKVMTSSGSEVIISGDHPLLSIKDNKISFLPSEELSEGSWIGLARKLEYSQVPLKNINEEYFQFKGKNGVVSTKVKVPLQINEDLAYFLGLYVAEGRWQGNIMIYNQNKLIQQKIKSIVHKVFSYPEELIELHPNYVYIRKSRSLIEILQQKYSIPIETTKQSALKSIPKEIFNSRAEIAAAFISGYIDGDGYISRNRGFQCVSASKILIEQLRLLLLKWEIQSRVRKTLKYASNTKKKQKKNYFSLFIQDSENLKKLNQITSLEIEYKRKNLHSYSNKSSNTNVDVVPGIGNLLYKIKQESKATFNNLELYPATLRKIRLGEREASRSFLQSFVNKQNEIIRNKTNCTFQELEKLRLLSNADVFWDKVKEITLVEEDMYDFEIEDIHNYIVNGGLVVHNSMLGLALAELLPKSELKDILAEPNPNDENNPLIKEMEAGKGREEVKKYNIDAKQVFKNNNFLLFAVAILTFIAPWWIRNRYESDLMFTAFFLGGMLFLAAFAIMSSMGPKMFKSQSNISPKIIVDNFEKKQAAFLDATGAHAGALLGDILHDPFQCHSPVTTIYCVGEGNCKINEKIDKLFDKHKTSVVRKKEKNYEAIFLPKNEFTVLGETNGSLSPVEVLSSNRHSYEGEMIKLTTSKNKELIVTPEHKVAIWKDGKISYVEAEKINEGDQVIAQAEDIIIDEQDVINTYDKKQQEQCKLYYQYREIKKKNLSWGYKKIAKAMNQPIGKTRWWHTGEYIPVPIQTANWLKRRKLLPLKTDNPKLPFVAKVLGATFGDGGIFENLNAIFLSSSELEATQEFGNDLMFIFDYAVDNNMRTIRGGRNETSFCYQNTNRNIIRFFKALGAPVGKKTTMSLIIPDWIKLNEMWEHEFYGALFGSEIGISFDRKCGARIELGISGEPKLESNRINFLSQIINYLDKQDITVGKIHNYNIKKYEGRRRIFRFIISQRTENNKKFAEKIKLNYCDYKRENLKKYLNYTT